MVVQDQGIDDAGEKAQQEERKTHEARPNPCPIVGVGASAGGLEALQELFTAMPADSGMAFVVVQHFDPRHETLMPELLARHTPMPVSLVSDETRVETDHVYVIPPNATLTIDDCLLRVTKPDRARGRRSPIDSFFRSLAEDQGDDAVGVILSGTGTDGALGLKAVKEHGGLTLVQAPATARYDSMPRAALLTGMADAALPVQEMPARLQDHLRHIAELRGGGADGFREELESHLVQISSILRRRTGHDFSRYKRSTLVRRIRRRMGEMRAESVGGYVAQLRQDPKEVDHLFHDLLIGVTHFFRDPEAFAVLARKVIPKLFEKKGLDGQVRVWVSGCATGEEAYSIAILLREHALSLEEPPQIQVFATDIDAQALEVARQAMYPERIAEQISAERLSRFFVRHGNMLQVAKEIREMCLFSTHNLITDPPFSRLDLLSCRNLLIYLESDLQKKLVPLCHYALRSGGFLFLGPSESVASWPELFRTVDRRHRIFQTKDVILRPPVSFPLAERSRYTFPRWHSEEPPPLAGSSPQSPQSPNNEQSIARTFERILLENFSPPCVLVNERGDIAYFSPRTGKYLEPPSGTPSLNVIEMARKGLRLDLRTALHKAITSRAPVEHDSAVFEVEGGGTQRVRLAVRPMFELGGDDPGLYMVVFQEVPGPAASGPGPDPGRNGGAPDVQPDADAEVRRLESELRSTKDHLQATLEELESSNEELVSSNEELLSINEELQSTNEELQTSKEELQSVNEELETINTELKKKIDETDRANSDLMNLFQSTQIATIFVDRELRIKKFTPAATDVFRLIDSDVGRLIADIAPRFMGSGDLVADIKGVLRTLSLRERQVRLVDEEAWYILRILPYRTVDNRIDGVVMTFIDITELRRAQEQKARLAHIVESSQDAIVGKTLEGIITSWNAGAEAMYGYAAQEAVGRPVDLLLPAHRAHEMQPFFDRLREGEAVEPFETERVRKDGRRIHVLLSLSPVHDAAGRVVGVSAIERDITDRMHWEEVLQRSEERYRSLVEVLTSVVWTADPEGRLVTPQRSWEAYSGQPWEEHNGWGWLLRVHPDDRERVRTLWTRAVLDRTVYQAELRVWHAASGRYRHVVARAVPLLAEDGAVREWVGTVTDVEDRKQAEEALKEAARRKDEFLAMLGHELRNPLAPVRNCLHVLALPNASESQRDRARATIERQVHHLTRLVDDLLDVSRISQGKILLRKERLDLVDLVRAAVEDHRSALLASGLSLETDLSPEPLWVSGDPTRLAQTVGNVLHNANKFTDRGGRVSLSVRREPGSGMGVVAVQDTGIGIEPEVLVTLFEPFSQAPPGLDRGRGGLGLGLALVRRLVELHGGVVEAASEGIGRGAEIRLRLPLEPAEDNRSEPAGRIPQENGAQRPRRCLIIEDNEDAAESMGLLLQLEGHEVAIARDGAGGIAMARLLRPEIVLCDIGLPNGLDGYGVARAFREDPEIKTACLIALTGYGQEEDQRRAHEAGFDFHMTKPADLEVLRRLITECP
jgi:two-component system CheB/CheR fusion protein